MSQNYRRRQNSRQFDIKFDHGVFATFKMHPFNGSGTPETVYNNSLLLRH